MPSRVLRLAVIALVSVLPVRAARPQAVEMAKLMASDGRTYEMFGSAVSVSGAHALVGAEYDDELGLQAGSTYVFEQQPTGAWMQVAKLLAREGQALDHFGYPVAISGDRALVGSRGDDDVGANAGSVHVFERQGGGAWKNVAELHSQDGGSGDHLGAALSLSGQRAIVGSSDEEVLGMSWGSAYVFERHPGGTWIQVAKLVVGGALPTDFGQAVSIHGTVALVGAHGDDDMGFNAGAAYVFERQPSGIWIQAAKLLASDGTFNDFFGRQVCLGRNRALIGAYGDGDQGAFTGSAYVFERQPDGAWVEVAKLHAHDGKADDHFGSAVSLSGDRALVGAYHADGAVPLAGAAYEFARRAGGGWSEVSKLVASDGGQGDLFGAAVSISGNRTIIGAWSDDGPVPDVGSAYVFQLSD